MASVVANQANIISNSLFFHVNGQPHNVNDAQPEETLLSYLRRTGYTGTKLGCGEGGCGACTVMVSQLNLSDCEDHLKKNGYNIGSILLRAHNILIHSGYGS